MLCPNCGKEALNINGRQICLDCGIEVARGAPTVENKEVEIKSSPEVSLSEKETPLQESSSTEGQGEVNIPEVDIASGKEPKEEMPADVGAMTTPEPVQENEQPAAEVPISQQNIANEIYKEVKTEDPNIEAQKESSSIEQAAKEIDTTKETDQIESVAVGVEEKKPPLFEGEEGEKIDITVAEEKEEAPSVDLTKPRSEDFEDIESKPISEIISKEAEAAVPPKEAQNETTEDQPAAIPSTSQPQVAVDSITSNIVDANQVANVQSFDDNAMVPPTSSGSNMEVMPASVMIKSGLVKKIIIFFIILGIVITLISAFFIFKNKFTNVISEEESVEVIE